MTMAARTGRLVLLLALVGCGDDDPPARMDAAPVAKDAAAPDAPGKLDANPVEAAPPGAETGVDGQMMCAPIAGCTPSASGACDPICQARCGCGQRCAFFDGKPACVPPAATPVPLGGTCSESTDDCVAGAVCLNESSPACKSHCYRYCRTDADCPGGALCSFEVEIAGTTVAKACTSPPEACDPTGAATCTDPMRPAPTFGCYVLSALAPDKAVCDCAGTKAMGVACTFEHECAPGLECIRVGNTPGVCRRICKLGVAGGCPGGVACSPLGTPAAPSTVHGYCPT
jgi:hypothetical protein